MAKRLVKKPPVRKTAKSASLKPKPPKRKPCSKQPCKKVPAYMRLEKGKPVCYCADHWKSVVESKKEFARAVVRSAREQEELRLSRPKKKIRRRRIKK